MTTWSRFLPVFVAMILTQACVSTGAKEITNPGLTAKIEAGKSDKAEVSALLGFPAIVTYGQQREETWDYYYVTEYPKAVDFVPVVNALGQDFNQTTKQLTISFDRKGLVRNLQMSQASGSSEVYPY